MSAIYKLGKPVLGGQRTWISITEEQYHLTRTARRNFLKALRIEELFDLLLGNYQEFEEQVIRYAVSQSIYDTDFYSSHFDERRAINRRIVNLLSACRMYLDQMDRSVKSVFDKETEQYESIERFRATLYDESFSYRLMEALRNFTQHNGLPSEGLAVNFHRIEIGTDWLVAVTATPHLAKASIIEDSDFKARVKDEIVNIPDDRIDLKPHIREYVECLGKLHFRIRKVLSPEVESWREISEDSYRLFADSHGISDIESIGVLAAFWCDPDMKVIEEIFIIRNQLELMERLVNRNGRLKGLSRRFVTSQDIKSLKQN